MSGQSILPSIRGTQIDHIKQVRLRLGNMCVKMHVLINKFLFWKDPHECMDFQGLRVNIKCVYT